MKRIAVAAVASWQCSWDQGGGGRHRTGTSTRIGPVRIEDAYPSRTGEMPSKRSRIHFATGGAKPRHLPRRAAYGRFKSSSRASERPPGL